MAQRPRRRIAPSAAQTRLKELEARLAQLESQLKALRTETAGSVGAARVKLRRIERRAAVHITRAQRALKQSLDSISRTLTTSRESVGDKASRLTRAVRAGVRAGSLAYRRSRG
jgi:F0F1-type ATP synthase membrane subunit b/b'